MRKVLAEPTRLRPFTPLQEGIAGAAVALMMLSMKSGSWQTSAPVLWSYRERRCSQASGSDWPCACVEVKVQKSRGCQQGCSRFWEIAARGQPRGMSTCIAVDQPTRDYSIATPSLCAAAEPGRNRRHSKCMSRRRTWRYCVCGKVMSSMPYTIASLGKKIDIPHRASRTTSQCLNSNHCRPYDVLSDHRAIDTASRMILTPSVFTLKCPSPREDQYGMIIICRQTEMSAMICYRSQ